ncbi:MAG: YHYH protein [Verrucomicrobiota bacterium]
MKIKPRFSRPIFFVGLLFALVTKNNLSADSRIDSWLTTYSGKYARIYATTADLNSSNAVSTWSRNSLSQSLPAYCGVQEIYSSTSWVYIRSTGLGSQVMGPWYLNAGKTMLFPNVPVNKKAFYRIPKSPTVPGTKTLTGLGAIGYFVDGVAMFDNRDAFYWNGTSEGNGSGYWNRDAYVNESVTFDPALAHQENSGTYHYHANPIALRYLLGDNILFNNATKTYSENIANTNLKHSPIVGWVRDGHPVYGPYGYANATNTNSFVRRIISGYVSRNGQNGTDNLSTNGAVRSTIPAWAQRLYAGTPISGPTVSATYPFGRYLEDNAYLGDLTNSFTSQRYQQGVDFDLDEYNGRFCYTPEYPNGIYAYFVTISSNGAPAFPYNIGRAFYGSPTGNTVSTLAESVTTNFVGGTNATLQLNGPILNSSNSTVTLVWSSVEGGTYSVESKTNLANGWNTKASNIVAVGIIAQATTNRTGDIEFYRANRTGLANHDPVK